MFTFALIKRVHTLSFVHLTWAFDTFIIERGTPLPRFFFSIKSDIILFQPHIKRINLPNACYNKYRSIGIFYLTKLLTCCGLKREF